MSAAPQLLENFYPCPVCVGLPLSKLRFQKQSGEQLILDHCQRCGGMWFDYQEVHFLRQMPRALLQDVRIQAEVFMMACHQCHQLMPRGAEKCSHCRWQNRLDCPVCEKQMQRKAFSGLTLDLCRHCKGVWFDNHELAQLWNAHLGDLPGADEMPRAKVSEVFRSPTSLDPLDAELAAWVALDVLEASPEIAWGMAQAAGALAEVSTGFVSTLSNLELADVGDALGSGFEAVAAGTEGLLSVSGSLFESIAEILGSLFELLDFS